VICPRVLKSCFDSESSVLDVDMAQSRSFLWSSRPKVSVVMPSVGRPSAKEAINSVLNQSVQDVELIVIVDPWTDEEAADKMPMPEDERVRVIRPKQMKHCPEYLPARIARLRNYGVALATGRYIAHLDDDNWWSETHLADLCVLLDEQPQLGFAYCWRTLVDSRGAKVALYTYPWSTRFENRASVFAAFVQYGMAVPGQPFLRDAVIAGAGDEIFHVDTSELCLRREVQSTFCFREQFTLRQMIEGYGEDRALCEDLYRGGVRWACSEHYTLFYRLGGYSNADS